jgi:hypothetical protein
MRKKMLFVALGVVLLAAVVAASIFYIRPPKTETADPVEETSPVKAPTEQRADFPPGVAADNPYALQGLLDITAAPYKADPTGASDSTKAIQKAVDEGYAFNMQVYFPSGTYKVSDTIEARVPPGRDKAARKEVMRVTQERIGNTLVGSTTGAARPVIVLADNSPGFDGVNGPYATVDGKWHIKPVIHFWRESNDANGQEEPNVNYNNVIRGIDFKLGNNPGAAAIRHQGCELSSVEDVKVDAHGAFAGVYDILGSGGSIINLGVTGGKYGIFAEHSQPSPLIAGLKLSDQSDTAIYYQGLGPLTVAGFTMKKQSGPVIRIENGPDGLEGNGNMSLVDGTIELGSMGSGGAAGVAIQNSDRSIYLRDVYMKNAAYIVRHSPDPTSDQPIAANDQAGWVRIDEYAYNQGYTPNQNILVDGAYSAGKTYPAAGPYYSAATNPPADPVSRHVWTGAEKFAAFDQPGVINVKVAPYNAKGDGTTDDTKAIQSAIDAGSRIFLPKGNYVISDSLRLKADTMLFGVSHTTSVITVNPTAFPAQDTPMIASPDDAGAKTALANVRLELPQQDQKFYAIRWQAGGQSVVKDIWIKPKDTPSLRDPKASESCCIQIDAPHNPSLQWVIIEGNGGGRWYNLVAPGQYGPKDPGFRIQTIRNTSQPLLFYMFHSSHARTGNKNPQAEIINSSNVTIFSSKFEVPHQARSEIFSSALSISHSRNINIFGVATSGKQRDGQAFVSLNESRDSANDNEDITISSMAKNTDGTPLTWYYVGESYHGGTFNIPGANVGNLFKRGHSTVAMPK